MRAAFWFGDERRDLKPKPPLRCQDCKRFCKSYPVVWMRVGKCCLPKFLGGDT